jgi:hypothetical protein
LTREGIGGVRGESRWPSALTLLVAIVVPLLLPDRFSVTPKWIGPALLTLLLVAHTIADPGRIDGQSRATRAIGIGLVAVLVAGAATQAVVLIVELVSGNKALNSADALLSSGALVWLNTIIAFTFLDGPDERDRVQPDRRDATATLGQADDGRPGLDLADHPRARHRARGEHPHLTGARGLPALSTCARSAHARTARRPGATPTSSRSNAVSGTVRGTVLAQTQRAALADVVRGGARLSCCPASPIFIKPRSGWRVR